MIEAADFWKRRARKAYLKHEKATDHLDCGNAVARMVSSRSNKHAIEFNEAMDRLAEFDPDCPKGRL